MNFDLFDFKIFLNKYIESLWSFGHPLGESELRFLSGKGLKVFFFSKRFESSSGPLGYFLPTSLFSLLSSLFSPTHFRSSVSYKIFIFLISLCLFDSFNSLLNPVFEFHFLFLTYYTFLSFCSLFHHFCYFF